MDHKINTTIEGISKKSTKKDGSPYIDKNKKPFTVVSIKLSEDLINDTDWNGWCSFMDYSNDFQLNTGDSITGIISKRVVDDKIFWNYRQPSRLDELEERVLAIENILANRSSLANTPDDTEDFPDEMEVTPEDDEDIDLPF